MHVFHCIVFANSLLGTEEVDFPGFEDRLRLVFVRCQKVEGFTLDPSDLKEKGRSRWHKMVDLEDDAHLGDLWIDIWISVMITTQITERLGDLRWLTWRMMPAPQVARSVVFTLIPLLRWLTCWWS